MSDDSESDYESESQDTDSGTCQKMVIEFHENVAEAVEPNRRIPTMVKKLLNHNMIY